MKDFIKNIRLKLRLKSFVLLIAFALLILSAYSFASEACDVATKLDFGTSGEATSANSNWKTLSLIAIMISMLITSLVYMLGKMLDNTALINRAKTDLTQVIATVVFLIVFFSFVTTICSIDASQFGIGSGTLFDAAHNYWTHAKNLAIKTYMESVNLMMILSALSSVYISSSLIPIKTLNVTMSFLPFSGFSAFISPLRFIMGTLSMVQIALAVAYGLLLKIIEGSFLNLLLPAGVICRCFSPTRELGGVLISISVGIFVFYPLLFGMMYLMQGTPDPDVGVAKMNWQPYVLAIVSAFTVASFFPWASMVLAITTLPIVTKVVAAKIVEMLSSTGILLLSIFIFPALSWIIIVAVVRDISRALGEEVDISSLTRLI